jgi:hypothetical protein
MRHYSLTRACCLGVMVMLSWMRVSDPEVEVDCPLCQAWHMHTALGFCSFCLQQHTTCCSQSPGSSAAWHLSLKALPETLEHTKPMRAAAVPCADS